MTDPILVVRAAVALIAAATIVAAFARRASLPDSIVLVLAGLLGANLFPEIALAVTPGLVLGVFVPGLVFAAAYSTQVSNHGTSSTCFSRSSIFLTNSWVTVASAT